MEPCIHKSVDTWSRVYISLWTHGAMYTSGHGHMEPCIHQSVDTWSHVYIRPWTCGALYTCLWTHLADTIDSFGFGYIKLWNIRPTLFHHLAMGTSSCGTSGPHYSIIWPWVHQAVEHQAHTIPSFDHEYIKLWNIRPTLFHHLTMSTSSCGTSGPHYSIIWPWIHRALDTQGSHDSLSILCIIGSDDIRLAERLAMPPLALEYHSVCCQFFF